MKKPPRATHQGVLSIGNVNLPCFVLEDGRRVISGRGMTKAIGMKGRGQGVRRITAHKTLKPFINSELDLAIQNPNWRNFERLFKRAFPNGPQQLEMPFMEDIDNK